METNRVLQDQIQLHALKL